LSFIFIAYRKISFSCWFFFLCSIEKDICNFVLCRAEVSSIYRSNLFSFYFHTMCHYMYLSKRPRKLTLCFLFYVSYFSSHEISQYKRRRMWKTEKRKRTKRWKWRAISSIISEIFFLFQFQVNIIVIVQYTHENRTQYSKLTRFIYIEPMTITKRMENKVCEREKKWLWGDIFKC
jgi:hypothetical protein